MSIIGTKNLGLIKAIHVGVNPPLNTKILWYNDANTPYTTGPAKVHYYYDVILADWYPLIGAASSAGGYTYIAFATDCSGSDFTLNFDPNLHCYWAVVTSAVAIPNIDLRPDLFADRWTEFCKCDKEGKPQFVYLRFSDYCDCEGEVKLYTEPKYEVPCVDCTWADDYQPVSQSERFNMVYGADDITVQVVGASAGDQFFIEPKILSTILTPLTSYAMKISATLTAGQIGVDLGDNGDTLLVVDGMVDNVSSHLASPESLIRIKIVSTGTNETIDGDIRIKLGTVGCAKNGEADLCWKCRKYWSIVVSDVEMSEQELWEYICSNNLWLPISCECGCGGSGTTDDCCRELQEQINTLYLIVEQLKVSIEQKLINLQILYDELKEYIEKCCTSMTLKIEELTVQNTVLSTTIGQMQTYYDNKLLELENRLIQCCERTQPDVLDPIITDIANSVVVKYKDESFDPAIRDLTNQMVTADSALSASLTTIDVRTSEKDTAQDLTLANHEERIIVLEGGSPGGDVPPTDVPPTA